MIPRLASTSLATLALLFMLVGCGKDAAAPGSDEARVDPSAVPRPTGEEAAGGEEAKGAAPAAKAEEEAGFLHVYTARHYDGDGALYEAFTKETGVQVKVHEAKGDALLARLKAEGKSSPADVLITVDAGRLYAAEAAGVLQPTESKVLSERVPEALRHPEGLWFGISTRARVIVHHEERVPAGSLARYEDLADSRWKEKVLIRSSSNVYNQSLVASIMAAGGLEATEAWAKGLVANLARKPQGGDRDQVRALAAGLGDIAVVNTYYLAQMMTGKEEDKAAVGQVSVLFPNQSDRGTHINISGAGITAHAPNREHAQTFVEWLVSDEAQGMLAGGNQEYPVVSSVQPTKELAAMGGFKADPLAAHVIGEKNRAALELMDRAGWR